MRVASLTPSNTEIVTALGLAHTLVGVDDHTDDPQAAHAARLGPDLSIDVDRLAALRPDLVLTSLSVPGMERVVEAVERASLPHLTLDPVTLADVTRDLHTVGAALGVPDRADALARDFERDLAAWRVHAPTPPRVLVEWWPKPVIGAARDSWITDLLAGLGAQNALAHLPVRSAPLTPEALRDLQLDLLVLSWCGARKLRPEVAHARGLGVPVACIHERYLGRPGPNLREGARLIAQALGVPA
ncbi:helical backbone metal receptor [Deinococcus maricopensis]|uniref:ABC-type transporter, periplasmic subunit n=1 Tax=Deinococcus maricopensis (strain DSM 21211 / LMG 22137 / NRRL B-23946 / LB-34) TaxID=709986 RepID=E8U816_DEIML|nr:helical backbone metal receptor [Deinococcus maricopensis]ADV67205.1 ABC-type transporter, periplasmic subunit [Deinococcus maricopensis DSM 21211]